MKFCQFLFIVLACLSREISRLRGVKPKIYRRGPPNNGTPGVHGGKSSAWLTEEKKKEKEKNMKDMEKD